MSENIDIRSGGAVAVDSESLRDAAQRYDLLERELEEVAAHLRGASGRVHESGQAFDAFWFVQSVRVRLHWVRWGAAIRAWALRTAAARYEFIELTAERQLALSLGDARGLAAIDARMRLLAQQFPGARAEAEADVAARQSGWDDEMRRQAFLLGGGTAVSLFQILSALTGGRGTIDRNERLGEGNLTAVSVKPHRLDPSAAPKTLAEASTRVPSSAQVRVEKYRMRGGGVQYAVYIAGTLSPGDAREPWNMISNTQLYTGTKSASFQATVEALKLAGVKPGDPVNLFGYSQGGMIAHRLALEGGLNVDTVVTFGSPVEADLNPDVTAVTLRHIDDPVAALSAGGHVDQVGSSESFVAERVADPRAGVQDLLLGAHALDEYTVTAQLVDNSADPRVQPVRDLLHELGNAEQVAVTEYTAERLPDPEAGGQARAFAKSGSAPTLPRTGPVIGASVAADAE